MIAKRGMPAGGRKTLDGDSAPCMGMSYRAVACLQGGAKQDGRSLGGSVLRQGWGDTLEIATGASYL